MGEAVSTAPSVWVLITKLLSATRDCILEMHFSFTKFALRLLQCAEVVG
jgi:hypothetical protein